MIGKPDDRLGEEVVAVVVLRGGQPERRRSSRTARKGWRPISIRARSGSSTAAEEADRQGRQDRSAQKLTERLDNAFQAHADGEELPDDLVVQHVGDPGRSS